MVTAYGVKNLLLCEIEGFDWIDYDDNFPIIVHMRKLVQARLYNGLSIVMENVLRDRVIREGWQNHLKSSKVR